MEAEASEFGDVIHDVVVLHVSEHMLVEAPTVRVNKGRKQGQKRWSEKPIQKKDGGPEQEAAVHVGPEAGNDRQRVEKPLMFRAREKQQCEEPGKHMRAREPVNAGGLEKNHH